MPKLLRDVLTPELVEHAAPGRYVDGDGLHLLVRPSGSRSWVYRYMVEGRSHELGLGSARPDGLSLTAARDRRNQLKLRLKRQAGGDPARGLIRNVVAADGAKQ